MQGILIVDKPMDWTSFDVVAKLRGVLGTRKLGHSGTLDPMATGVLPVFCGGASKAVDLQLNHDKTYRATLRLGARTDTGDSTGMVLETAPVTAGEKELLAVLPQFIGPQMQVPPMYSAVKINGQPLYKLAREGVTVERKARPIEIYGIEYGGSPAENEYVLTVRCSKGTYIRTLLEEIAAAMGQKGTMSALRRTAAGLYTGFCSIGINITYEQMLKLYPDAVITRAHFADYLVKNHYTGDRNEAFDRYLSPGKPCFVNRHKVDPSEAVSIIHQAGGVAVLAHPILYHLGKAQMNELINHVCCASIDGIEAIYSTYKPADEREIRKIAKEHNLLLSGGSDYHGANKPNIQLGTGLGHLFVPYEIKDALYERSLTFRQQPEKYRI